MYSNPHAATGLAITATTLAITKDLTLTYSIGLPLAIISHYYLDFLRESNLGSKGRLYYDILPSLIYYIVGYFSGYFLLFMLSWIAGNLLDIIDKKFYLSIFFPKKYKSTEYFHTQKTGINFTLNQTRNASILSTIVIIIIGILLTHFN